MVQMIKPLIPIKQEGLDDIAKSLLETSVPVITPAEVGKPQDYLLLPQTREHPEIPISLTRLVYTPSMEQILKSLNINAQNNNNRDPLYREGYLGDINYQQANNLNKALDGFMLPPNLFVEFLNQLRSGNAFDENGNRIDTRKIEAILSDVYEVRSPWRSEGLSHKYSEKDSHILVTYPKFNTSGQLIEVTEELDSITLRTDKLPGISLESWLRNPTSQGFPRIDVASGNLYYWYPRNGNVARFSTDSVGAVLDCDGDPSCSNPGLGVRHAKIKP